MILDGISVTVNDLACRRVKRDQYKFLRSKSKRVRKKWFKRAENYRYNRSDVAIQIGNTLLVTSEMYDQIKNIT